MYVCMLLCMNVCIYACVYVCRDVGVYVWGGGVGVGAYVCMYIHTYLYILYVLYIWGILLCYGGRGGGTVVSVYSFVFYVLLFDDFLQ